MKKLTRDEISSLYRELLGRECADEIGMEALTRLPSSEVLKILISSSEIRDGIMRPPGRDDIKTLFDVLLQRDVESEVVMSRHLKIATIRDAVTILTESIEFREKVLRSRLMETNGAVDVVAAAHKSSRILCIGAYGNSNLGDREQASAIGDILIQAGVSASDLYACSWEIGGGQSYLFPGRRLPRSSVLDFTRLAEMGLVVIGGGGILGTPHFPLYDERWVEGLRSIGVPYVLWAVGGSFEHLQDPAFSAAYTSLIGGASLVSARDEESLEAFRTIRPDVTLLDDPLLRAAILAHPGPPTQGLRIEAILKFPVNSSERGFVEAFERFYARTSRDRLGVVFVEPSEPEEMIAMQAFPGARTASNSQELAALLNGASLGCTMRLHGAGAIVKEGLPLIGLSSPKIRYFMKTIGLETQFVPFVNDELFNRLSAPDFTDFKAAGDKDALARIVENRQSTFTRQTLRLLA